MKELRRRNEDIQFVDFEHVLDEYLAEIDKKDKERVQADFQAFKSYYFDHNDDVARRQRFVEFLQ